ncbi:MAG: hypothetical protein GXP49_07390 [Deltaproteobacteria bacterium]|nr:hypothetical protein [Deltaproteobacteria bacterium]
MIFSACGDSGTGGTGSGELQVTTWGEDYIENNIPASAFEDGYSVKYAKFMIVLGNIKIADHSGDVGATMSGQKVFDMTLKGPHQVQDFKNIGAKRWDRVSIEVKPAGADTQAGNDIDAKDLALMKDNGYSFYVQGEMTKGQSSKTFSWGFSLSTEYKECQRAPEDGGEVGVSVPDGGTAVLQFTIHGDHLFYDDLASPDAVLRGDAIFSSDKDQDGKITMDELDSVDLSSLPENEYGTGGAPDVYTLADFVKALSRTVVHFQGEGHCHSHVED